MKCRLFLMLLLLATFAIPAAWADTVPTSGKYYETTEDLRVKVLSGFVKLERTWTEGKWHFNRHWNRLQINRDLTDNSVTSIERNGHRYEKATGSTNLFRFGKQYTIQVVADGFRWEDRRGNWIAYDANGLLQKYGDRNNVQVLLSYDGQSRLTGVADHHSAQVLWFEYQDDKLVRVRDDSNRQVQYRYEGDALTTVVDARGFEWKYADGGGQIASKTDPEGRTTTFSYNGGGQLAKIEDALGVYRQYAYDYDSAKQQYYLKETDSAGKVTERWYRKDGELVRQDINGQTSHSVKKDGNSNIVTDRNGYETRNDYDEWGNLLKTVYPDGSSESFEYEPKYSNLIKSTNENGVVTTYQYDAQGNRIRMTEAVGTNVQRVTEYSYDAYGNRISQKRLGDAVTAEATTTTTYDGRGNVAAETDLEGHTTAYTHDAMGNVLARTDARGKIWRNEYDPAGNVTAQIDPLDHATRYEYDKVGNQVKKINAAGHATAFTYDARNRLTAKTDIVDKPYRYEFDSEGRITVEIDEEGKRLRTYAYDAEGRKKSITDGSGNTTRYEYGDGVTGVAGLPARVIYPTYTKESKYDRRNRLVEEIAVLSETERLTTRYSYDAVGNQISVIDRAGRTTRYEYDSLNRRVRTIDALGGVVALTYDNRDNMIALTDPNTHTTRFVYNRNNLLLQEIRPLGQTTHYLYDAAGNLVEKVDPKNQRTVSEYDDAGRRIVVRYHAANQSTPERTVAFTYNALNKFTSYNDSITSATYDYDELQHKVGETINYGPFSLTYHYDYYANGNKKSYTNPNGTRYGYTYNMNNQINSIIIQNYESIIINEYYWQAPKRIIFPNSVVREYDYDKLLNIKSISVKNENNYSIINYRYFYDAVGNIIKKETENGNYFYSYDALDRLISAENSVLPNEEYTYDLAGNRLSDARTQGLWEYNENHQLTAYSDVVFYYDNNGNTIQKLINGKIAQEYDYNVENRLNQIKDGITEQLIATYYYNPFGKRLFKEVNGMKTYYLYNDEGLAAEYDLQGNNLRNYGYKPNSSWMTDPVFMEKEGVYQFYQNDYLGTPQKIIDNNGNVQWDVSYDSFGRLGTVNISLVENNIRLPGQYYDAESGLHYNIWRTFSPILGRYFEIDLLRNAYDFNHYIYAKNNPIKLFDNHGLFPSYDFLPPSTQRNILCLADLAEEVKKMSKNDGYRHCYVSCAMVCKCGLLPEGSFFVGISKEFFDILGLGIDPRDFIHDWRGVSCATSGTRECCDGSHPLDDRAYSNMYCCVNTIPKCKCARCCSCYYNINKPLPGWWTSTTN